MKIVILVLTFLTVNDEHVHVVAHTDSMADCLVALSAIKHDYTEIEQYEKANPDHAVPHDTLVLGSCLSLPNLPDHRWKKSFKF